MTAEQLEKELYDVRKYTLSCCGLPPLIRYEPGCSSISCHKCKRVAKRPDWEWRETIKEWNNHGNSRTTA